MMTPIHYHTKRSFWLIRAVGAAVFAVVCGLWLRRGFDSFSGWVGLVGFIFFGLGVIVGLVQGLRRAPRLTIDDQGVHDRTLGVGIIAWSDILRAEPYGVAQQPFVGLYLRDPDKYLARASTSKKLLARLNAGAGFPLSINLAGLDADPGVVAEMIMARSGGWGEVTNTT